MTPKAYLNVGDNAKLAGHTKICKKTSGKQTQFDLDCERCNKDSYNAITALRPEAIKAEGGHTPIPWKVQIDSEYPDDIQGIYTADGKTRIVETDSGYYPPKLADANFICTAVNAYERDQEIKKELFECLLEAISMTGTEYPETIKRWKQAIAKAEAK